MKRFSVFWIVCAVFIFVVGCSKSSQCNSAGGIWNENEKTCTKKSDCVPIPAALKNAEWNGETSYIQNYSMGKWSAPFETQYGREQGTCRFKCEEGYSWTGSSCVPECDKNTASFPCRDSSTGYIWSEKASGKNWKTAKSHCKDLNAENYGGFTGGWQMPNIDKLRTLLISEKMKAQCKVSEVNDCLSIKDCWSCETCSEDGYIFLNSTCSSKSSFNDGRYSKFGDADTLLSSSTGKLNDSSFAWGVNFRSGNIHDLIYDDISYNVRCVRNDGSPLSACTEAGGTWNEDEGVCKVKCSDKPDNTEWNGTSFYTRTYDDGTLSGKAVTEYNDKTEGACHFKCEEDYVWIDNQCKPECNKNTTSFPCIDLSTGYIWSDKEKSIQGFRDAKNYCDQLNKQNYGNFSSSGWHLPTIEELKTLVISDRVSTKCKLSEAKKCLSFKNCWSCSTCTAAGNQSTSSNDCDYWGVYYNDGRYSKFGDSGTFWSSSIPDEFKSDVWDVTFGSGSVGRSSNATFLKVRCVRNSK